MLARGDGKLVSLLVEAQLCCSWMMVVGFLQLLKGDWPIGDRTYPTVDMIGHHATGVCSGLRAWTFPGRWGFCLWKHKKQTPIIQIIVLSWPPIYENYTANSGYHYRRFQAGHAQFFHTVVQSANGCSASPSLTHPCQGFEAHLDNTL